MSPEVPEIFWKSCRSTRFQTSMEQLTKVESDLIQSRGPYKCLGTTISPMASDPGIVQRQDFNLWNVVGLLDELKYITGEPLVSTRLGEQMTHTLLCLMDISCATNIIHIGLSLVKDLKAGNVGELFSTNTIVTEIIVITKLKGNKRNQKN